MKKSILMLAVVAVVSASCSTYSCPTYSKGAKPAVKQSRI